MILTAVLGFLALLVLLAAGVPIYLALIGVAAGLLLLEGVSVAGIGQAILDQMNSEALMAVPFFVLAAAFIRGGGIARALIEVAAAWLGRLPAGLPIAALAATGVFAAINGSSVATAMAMGSVAIPALIERGYPRQFAVGLTAAAGTLGILLPPSLPLVIYGLISETSIPRLFLAGIVPGLILLGMFMLVAVYMSRRLGMKPDPFPGWPAFGRANLAAIPALAIPVVVLGGIYGGFITVTESSALAALLSLVVSLLVYRAITTRDVMPLLLSGMSQTAAVLIIVSGAALLSYWISRSGLPADVVRSVVGLNLEPWQFLVLMTVVLIALGTVLEAYATILMTVPITLPILDALGIDRIHYAIVVVITIEIGLLTPPVALNLFVVSEVSKAPVGEVIRGTIPYVAAMIVLLGLMIVFPQLALWLPNTAFER
ncbi:MAG: C4-dicarboxylate ABC transporter permease [Alphaproteobacteria bacterium]|nr:MAG: C4-dicarboxylate ABC transporter permease [Alphaproteobacteria bacterium]